jgi:succinoglycan biosynthesis transport protein ExoP
VTHNTSAPRARGLVVQDYLDALRRGWGFVVGGVLVGAAIAGGATLLLPAQYNSSAKIYFSTTSTGSAPDLYQAATFSQQVANTFSSLTSTPYILAPVAKELRLTTRVNVLARSVDATVAPNSSILTVTVEASSPAGAARLADAISRRIGSVAPIVAPTSGSSTQSSVRTIVVQSAAPSTDKTSPNVPVLFVLCCVAGGTLGYAGALLRNRIRS